MLVYLNLKLKLNLCFYRFILYVKRHLSYGLLFFDKKAGSLVEQGKDLVIDFGEALYDPLPNFDVLLQLVDKRLLHAKLGDLRLVLV